MLSKRTSKWLAMAAGLLSLTLVSGTHAESDDAALYWMKLRANSKFERSVIADVGVAIESVSDDFVTGTGTGAELKRLQKMKFVETSFPVQEDNKDFPSSDAEFHNEAELKAAMENLVATYPGLVRMTSIGKSVEGRDIWALRISGDLEHADQLPAVIYMGGHHAREHLSVETPFRIWSTILERYNQGDERIRGLLNGRDVHLIPAVNPDGLEYDVETGRYRSWRKNRTKNSMFSYGVDLNRNYSFQWGQGGASSSPSSETFRGPEAFSEPETRAIRDYIEAHENITILLSFHTYSQLILYPWGYTMESIANEADRRVHEIMATKMAEWNGYTPQASSELYISSGDTTDWAYGVHRIISFTFELDPGHWGEGGFYPGAEQISPTVLKNIEPVLYLLENAGNPYAVIPNTK